MCLRLAVPSRLSQLGRKGVLGQHSSESLLLPSISFLPEKAQRKPERNGQHTVQSQMLPEEITLRWDTPLLPSISCEENPGSHSLLLLIMMVIIIIMIIYTTIIQYKLQTENSGFNQQRCPDLHPFLSKPSPTHQHTHHPHPPPHTHTMLLIHGSSSYSPEVHVHKAQFVQMVFSIMLWGSCYFTQGHWSENDMVLMLGHPQGLMEAGSGWGQGRKPRTWDARLGLAKCLPLGSQV